MTDISYYYDRSTIMPKTCKTKNVIEIQLGLIEKRACINLETFKIC